jgi:hypothetical protein
LTVGLRLAQPAFAQAGTDIMKQILAAIGLAAVGATALHGQTLQSPNAELTPQEKTKFWSISAALRGFYDDNYTAIPKNLGPLRSWGVEVSPSLSLNWQPVDTLLGASYVYDYKWYENQHQNDQTHQFNGKFVHNFTPRYRLELNDSFVSSSEPTVIDTTVITSPIKRTTEDNIRNRANILFAAELTPILGTEIGYQNTYYDYKQNLSDLSPAFDVGSGELVLPGPSRSALLDRMEHLITLDLRWKMLPETTGILGYQFEFRDFTSNESLNPTPLTTPSSIAFIPADTRNSDSHFLFVGVDQSIGPDLRASLRVGGQYLDYYNFHTSKLSPYADASLTYTYLPGSYLQVGLKHEHAATDIIGNPLDPVLDQEATTAYVAVTHKITARLVASAMGQYQNSQFNGGGAGIDNQDENFFLGNVNLAYRFNQFLLAETGYEFNRLDSNFNRDYTRNRAYLGLRGTY